MELFAHAETSFLIILVLLAGFYMAWAIGAQDVANAMGTSVGSGALTLKQAVMIAAVLEFSGAYFLGSHVSETVQKGIVDPLVFSNDPLTLVHGMLAALLAAGVWLQIASYFALPVSTTHTIVGALVGFGIVVGGIEAIHWENVGFILSSWVLCPLVGGMIGFILFTILRNSIFYTQDPIRAAKNVTPLLVFFVGSVMSFLIVSEGVENLHISLSFESEAGIIFLSGLTCSLISWVLLHRGKSDPQILGLESVYVEKIFGNLQIFSACLMAFAHGANDVANAIGPLAAAIGVLTTGMVAAHSPIPDWALALGGVGIILGLATWGWRVIETIGKKITELTPTRGFAAEFGTATTVLIASKLGMPVSTTHTLVGAVIGVGLARGIEALNLGMTRDIFLSWLITIPAGAGLALGFYRILAALSDF